MKPVDSFIRVSQGVKESSWFSSSNDLEREFLDPQSRVPLIWGTPVLSEPGWESNGEEVVWIMLKRWSLRRFSGERRCGAAVQLRDFLDALKNKAIDNWIEGQILFRYALFHFYRQPFLPLINLIKDDYANFD